jgi:haloalkane dehalogenase
MVLRQNMHCARYGEVFLVHLRWLRVEASIYNTLGLNDCPDDLWKELDPRQIKQQHHARAVILNGPRYFLMDSVDVQSTVEHEPVTFGRLAMRKLATLRLSLFDLLPGMRRKPYTERAVVRTTVYTYRAGQEVHELLSPQGVTYVMQSYSLEVDPLLNVATLKTLGDRLRMPNGWRYRIRQLDQDWVLRVEGQARVLQDELQNTYQRVG